MFTGVLLRSLAPCHEANVLQRLRPESALRIVARSKRKNEDGTSNLSTQDSHETRRRDRSTRKIAPPGVGDEPKDLGNELGVNFQQVQKYERGTNRLSGTRLVRASDVLSIDIGQLLSGGRNNDAPDAEAIQGFMASKDGVQLARLFMRLDKRGRSALLGPTKTLSD